MAERPLLAAWICAALALVAWGPSIGRAGFSFDDREALVGNPLVEGRLPWTTAFTRDYWAHRGGGAGHYRPLASLSLRVDRRLFAGRAWGYHLGNVLLHASAVLLLACAWRRARGELPWIGLTAFATHPALADAVAWISGRTAPLSLLGGLVGIHVALGVPRLRREHAAFAGALLATVLAGLAKEDGVVLGVFAALAARGARRSGLAGAVLGLCVLVGLRWFALGSPWPHAPHAPLAGMPLLERAAVGALAFLRLLAIAAVPLPHPPQLAARALQAQATVGVLCAGAALLAITVVLGSRRAWRRERTVLPFAPGASAVLAALAVVPLVQIVPAGEVFAARWIYLPLALAAPLVQRAGVALAGPLGRAKTPLAAVVLLAFLLGAWSRSDVYATRASYRAEILRFDPDDAPSWNDVGVAAHESGERARAREAFARAAALDPGYSRPLTNLANMAVEDGDLAGALEFYERAVRRGPLQPLAHVNRANALRRVGRPAEAADAAEAAVQLAPGMVAAWRALALAREALGDRPAAVAAYERALRLDPLDPLALAGRQRLGSP